jgi:hypothetical protein
VRNISIVKRLATLRHVNRRTDEGKDDRPARTEEYVRVIALLRPHTVTLLVTVAAVVVVVAAVLVATGTGPPSVTFQEPGHWVYNRSSARRSTSTRARARSMPASTCRRPRATR